MTFRFQNIVHPSCDKLKSPSATKFITPTQGVCYSFNHNDTNTLSSNLIGEVYGLQITIDLDTIHTMQGHFNDGNGVKVVLHDNDMFPMTNSRVSNSTII